MKTILSMGWAVFLLGAAVQVDAIEGGCKMYDVVGLEVVSSDGAQSVGGRISVEVAVDMPSEAWAVVAGGDFKSVSVDGEKNEREALGGDLGIKYYVTSMTGLSVFGRYEEGDAFAFVDVASVNILLDQKLTAPRSGVTPFVRLQGAARSKDRDSGNIHADNERSDDVMFKGTLGSDFMLSDTMALTLEGGYMSVTEAAGSSEGSRESIVAGISFKGYFD